MNCAEWREDLSAYVDGELPAERRVEVDAHLATCAACRQELVELRKLAAGVARLPGMQPADEFLADVRRKIARGERPEARSWREILFQPAWLKVPVQVAAIFVAVLTVLRLFGPSSPEYAASGSKLAKNEADRPAASSDDFRQLPAETPVAPRTPEAAPARGEELAGRVLFREAEKKVADGNAPAVAAPASPATVTAREPVAQSSVAEVIEVPAASVDEARARVDAVAKALDAPVTVGAGARSFYVSVPADKVGAFRSELTLKSALGEMKDTGEEGGLADRISTNVVLEIRVVTPAN